MPGDATGDVRTPWWSWGFAAAFPVAFLALVTPWFEAVAPVDHDLTNSYSAWTHPWFGVLGPLLLLFASGQWFGAWRGWWRPPAPRDWRGMSRATRYVGSSVNSGSGRGYVVTPGGGSAADPPPAPGEPVAELLPTASWLSVAYGAATLALLGLDRVDFHPVYRVFGLGSTRDGQGDMTVHAAFGCWCLLLAAGLFVVTGLLGALLTKVRSSRAAWRGPR